MAASAQLKPARPPPVEANRAVERFGRIREAAGLRSALQFLGETTGFACVAVVRLVGSQPSAIAYFDSRQPQALAPDAWPDEVKAGCLVRDGEGRVREARELFAVAAQPPGCDDPAGNRGCWCVPVIDREGELHASLCLFEAGPSAAGVDLSLLLQVASGLANDRTALDWSLAQLVSGAHENKPPAAWQSDAGEEDPGSALDEPPTPPPRLAY